MRTLGRTAFKNRSIFTSPAGSQEPIPRRQPSPWDGFKKVELLPSLRDREPIKNNPLPASHIKDVKNFLQNLQKTVALPSERFKAARSLMGTKAEGVHNFSFGNEFSVTRRVETSMNTRPNRYQTFSPQQTATRQHSPMKQTDHDGNSPKGSEEQPSAKKNNGVEKASPSLPKLPEKRELEKKKGRRTQSMQEPRLLQPVVTKKPAGRKASPLKRKSSTEDNERARRIAGDPAVSLFIVDIKSKLGLMKQEQKSEIENDLFREHLEAMEAKKKSSMDNLDFSKIGSAGELLNTIARKNRKSEHAVTGPKTKQSGISVPLEHVKERTETFGQDSYVLDKTERSALDQTLQEITGASSKKTSIVPPPFNKKSQSGRNSPGRSPIRSPGPMSNPGSSILNQDRTEDRERIAEESGSDFEKMSETSSRRQVVPPQFEHLKKKISRTKTREVVGSMMNSIMAQTSQSPDSSKLMEKARVNANRHISESNWQDDYAAQTRSPQILKKYHDANRKHKRMSSELNRGNSPFKYLKRESRDSYFPGEERPITDSESSSDFDPSCSTFPFINALFSDKKNLSYIASDMQYKKIERILNQRYGYFRGSVSKLDPKSTESPLPSAKSKRSKDSEGGGAVNELSFFKESGKSGQGSKKDTKQQIQLHTRYLNHLFLKTADDFLKLKYYAYIGKGQKKHRAPTVEVTQETQQQIILQDSQDDEAVDFKRSSSKFKAPDKISPMKQLFKSKVNEVLQNRTLEAEQSTRDLRKKQNNMVDGHIEKLQKKLKIYEENKKIRDEEDKKRFSLKGWFDP